MILASYLATQLWSWDKNPEGDVARYRIYWADIPTQWCQEMRVEVEAATCGVSPCGPAQCCGEPPPTGESFFILVTAVDSSGNESSTDHGPVQVCP